MLDFLRISTRPGKRGVVEIYPHFVVRKSKDLMIRGRDFYAVWVEDRKEWSTDEDDVTSIVDNELDIKAEEYMKKHPDAQVKMYYMWDSSTRVINQWHQYCQRDMRDNFVNLDENITFANDVTTKESYSSKRLPYPLKEEPCEAYDRLMSVLYSESEREKIEWAVGSIITGDSKKIQKFVVLYGSAGTGKSTVLNIIQKLFEGYYSTFDSRALGSSSDSFALEAFKDNPLIAIQHDGDLSRIEDNTRLNSLVSHETMRVNEKFRPTYSNKFISFLFMGTNKPVKITDAKSGLIRRLIDVTPTGNKVSTREYKELMKKIEFELPGIAWHCKELYLSDPGKYDNYIPVNMMGASNDFYNYVLDQFFNFEAEDAVTLGVAWDRYNQYCTDAKVLYPMSRRAFKEELKNYFNNFEDRYTLDDGTRIRSYYTGFKKDIFNYKNEEDVKVDKLVLRKSKSLLDNMLADCPAQYATEEGIPACKWSNVKTTLSDIDTTRLHYVKVPKNHIVIDFDIKDDNGEKSRDRNLEEASKWPPTYAEYSKGGAGVHLHYIYDGDVSMLNPIYSKDIEVKVFKGNGSLRRRLTKCNGVEVAHISSGLPLKEVKEKTISEKRIKNEKSLRRLIARHMRKEIMGYTKPSIDMIKKVLDECYADDIQYDVTDMADALVEFALSSTHNAEACLKIVNEMKLTSEPIMPYPVDEPPEENTGEKPIIFFDIEVYPNLFLICWKYAGEDKKCVRMFNPTAEEVEMLGENRLIGFNCRRYDNHICYGRILGETNEQLYNQSQAIISGDKIAFFGGAFDFSYTDVYDFSSKKQSLKKFEIELGIHHQEMGIPWDQPVPEDMWDKVADYCCNDVIATEATFNARQADFIAREILADVAGMNVNSTTNSLTTKIIFQGDKHPQDQFNYRDMGDENQIEVRLIDQTEYTVFDHDVRPIFPGYEYKAGKSTYRGEEVGEGGYVYSEPGIYGNVALLDIASMHPSSIIAENLFGKYTKRFKELVEARIAIKHKDFDKAKKMLGGVLAKYLDDPDKAKALSQALKIAINSVYGLTAAHFDNPFRDPRNKDNIVAKRGALFMVNLKHEVQRRGFTVAHIKTDSIKIPDATPEIIQFVMDYGKLYGYTFEHEDTYERMCLVNDAVYIAKSQDGHWSATGTQFAVPYVFKTLFSHEPIIFSDYCETKSVSGNSSIYLDMNEGLAEGEHNYIFVGRVGLFTPIKPGCGGGELYREKDGKYFAVTGTKGYRWLESEMVKELGKEDCIDTDYYERLVSEAKDAIREYSVIEDERHDVIDWFFSDVPYMLPPYKDGAPLHYYETK